jgi:hypothetical protein
MVLLLARDHMVLHLSAAEFLRLCWIDERRQQRTCAATIRLRRFNKNYATSPESCSNVFIDLQMTEIVAARIIDKPRTATYLLRNCQHEQEDHSIKLPY